MRRLPLVAIVLAGLVGAAPTAAAAPAPLPYGTNDPGGFRNVLPPGSNGLVNAAQAAGFLSAGTRPPHNDDQLRMYERLVFASPGLTAEQLPQFFKDATFGVREGDEERRYSPRADVTIQRDRGFGVPHITASTREGAMFAAGYVAAEDRLFLIDVLRHVGRAQTASFVGGSRGNRALDRDQWALAPYTEADLERQVDAFDDLYGGEGAQIQRDIGEYVAGVNAYIAQARIDPTKLPAEYAAIGRPQGPEDWRATDVVVTASLVGGIFGKGGGGEVDSALVREAARKRFGRRRGDAVWRDFRQAEDPEHDRTIKTRRVPFLGVRGRPDRRSVAVPDPGTTREHPLAPPLPPADAARRRSAGGTGGAGGGTLADLGDGLRGRDGSMSNALLVAGRESASGRPLAVFGPQTSYFSPQILMEQDVHAPTIDARGVAFPGTNLYVQLGRGRDYAWSATASGQDNSDTFAVELCEPDGGRPTLDSTHYRFRGACEPFEVLARTNAWSPTVADDTPAGSETLTALRSKLGLVSHRALVGGRPTAFTRLRSTYGHEVDSALGFSALNDPQRIRRVQDFGPAIDRIGYTFNWFYADAEQIAVVSSGALPVRARGANRDLPVRGEPRWEWRGYDPEKRTSLVEPLSRRPQEIDEPFLTNWNNSVGSGVLASDEQWEFGSVHRGRTLTGRVRAGIAGDRKLTREGLVDAMEDAATVDVRGAYVLPWALRVLGRQRDPALRDATDRLAAWIRDGAHRRDRDDDGRYEHSEAIKLADAWFEPLIRAQFEPVLGPELFGRIAKINRVDDTPNDGGARTTGAATQGWYSYAHKDLRTLLRRPVRGRYSRVYCGRGSRRRCRALLERTLREAIAADPVDLYRDRMCEAPADQRCFDAVAHRAFGVVSQPLIHWVNRPTFQQVVEIPARAPR